MINKDLLQRVMKRIDRDVTQWDQETWATVGEETQLPAPSDEYIGMSMPDREECSCCTNFLEEEFHVVKDIDLQGDLCGTTFCLAGHTILEAGEAILIDTTTRGANYCVTPDGRIDTIEARATELLGLNESQALDLFGGSAGHGDLDRYKEMVSGVTGVEFD